MRASKYFPLPLSKGRKKKKKEHCKRSDLHSLRRNTPISYSNRSQKDRRTYLLGMLQHLHLHRQHRKTRRKWRLKALLELMKRLEKISSESKFLWRDHRYPVSLLEDLDPQLPTPYQLLGRDLVLWFDKNSQDWVAFDDKCPRRLSPLSGGRQWAPVVFTLWAPAYRFLRLCLKDLKLGQSKSPRACATRFPTIVSQGLLFDWSDENGRERAQVTKPPL